MGKKPAEALTSLLDLFLTGYPREQWRAGQRLVTWPEDIQAKLVFLLLNEAVGSPQKQIDILHILRQRGNLNLQSIETVLRLVGHRKQRVRRAAADVLLHTSPKLRWAIPYLRTLLTQETEQYVRQVITKLLDRYPNG